MVMIPIYTADAWARMAGIQISCTGVNNLLSYMANRSQVTLTHDHGYVAIARYLATLSMSSKVYDQLAKGI